ncbi:SUMF1/EgtB/PvdO family nonheme iron enzyme [Luteimonas sp. e5]
MLPIAPRLSLVLLPLLVAACSGEPSTEPPPTEAETRLRRGLVQIGEDEMPTHALDWRPPVVVLGDEDSESVERRARTALLEGRIDEGEDSALALWSALAERPEARKRALEGIATALAMLREEGEQRLQQGEDLASDLARAHRIAAISRYLEPEWPATLAYLARVDAADRMLALLEHGENELRADRLGEDGIGAVTAFREVQRSRPDDLRARQGLAAVEGRLIGRAGEMAADDDFAAADAALAQAAATHEAESSRSLAAREAIAARRQIRSSEVYARLLHHLQRADEVGMLKAAGEDIALLEQVAPPGDARIDAAHTRLALAERYGRHRPGQMFTDALQGGGEGPSMVVVPHGEFLMGSPEDEADADKSEWPQHVVRFQRGFAMARHETTVGEFRRFMESTDTRTRAERRGYSVVYDERSGNFVLRNDIDWRHDYAGRLAADDLPVLHVSARDAEAYVEWLSAQSGHRYRLPSESEFEYALRAGRQSRFPWGEGLPPEGAGNLTGELDRSPSGRKWGNAFAGYGDGHWGPARAASFKANVYGLHDLAGNVAEWTMDCWHQGYRRAPADGAAWYNPGCRTRVVRGGAWSSSPVQVRAAWRMSQAHDVTNARTGFRVVRDI